MVINVSELVSVKLDAFLTGICLSLSYLDELSISVCLSLSYLDELSISVCLSLSYLEELSISVCLSLSYLEELSISVCLSLSYLDELSISIKPVLSFRSPGTESETKAFMAVCIETAKRYDLDDYRTPVFIFERLCSIIYPEENEVTEFFVTLEKDPQQEDFLQGRMPGNPYSSNEPGIGPLMRDIKNKICQDCDLVALLEDDSGMELLVNNKIISLDLPVAEVYKKVWCPTNEGEPMRIIYRMRGLLGDATEEFIESLDSTTDEEEDEEEVYKMAGVMAQCGGLECMLSRLSGIRDFKQGRHLLTVLLKLFSYCVKVKINRQQLVKPDMNTLNVMLGTLNLVRNKCIYLKWLWTYTAALLWTPSELQPE
ncbi:unnamed protein product [Oncorhynchus mykiss]|uniref:E3 ubiquitin ligase UBR4 C-terminal domain-containing protein n=1 Tax=Oncorhynchus mykiss TaxID=8022 RepID=A0A060YB45_ONCMY|nr:unnamed protein product [Oncorhynchus mykiss]